METMTRALEQAIERLRQVPEDRQESLARLLIHEIEEDQRWIHSTEAHADQLKELIADVLNADARGECEPLDPDRL